MKKVLICLILTGVVVISGAAKEWCGIVPLHSTRADVERLLKVKPERCGGTACFYDLSDKTVFALYADEPSCRNDDATTSWKVPRDTVIQITIRYKTPQLFSALGIDAAKYDRVPDKELPGLVYLTDYGQGIRMETSGDTVSTITYYSAKTDDHLRCRAAGQTSKSSL